MAVRCPGQGGRKLTVSYHPCPNCRRVAEFFSDEMRVRCRGCKEWIYQDQTPSCVQWCKAAKRCLGPERYEEVMKAFREEQTGQRKAKEETNG